MIVLIVLLNMSVGDIGSWALIKSILQTTLISGIMGVVVWLLAHFFELYISVSGKLAQMVEIIVAIGVGILVFAVLALLLKMPEAEQIMNILRRKFGRFGKRKAA
jgi:peptidoglycan biosynthesis protein MviN/MurJ (putative lipid II flippase)